MSRLLKLALIQQHVTKEKENNINRAVALFEQAAKQDVQLIAFAELAFTYFYPQIPSTGNNAQLAETIPGPATDIFSELARRWKVVVILNLFEKKGNQTFDSSPVIDANGKILGITRMVHIMEGPCFHEQGYYYPGEGKNLVYDTSVGKIGVAICYDRHYPEYMRALALQGAEIVVIPQAGAVGEWPPGLFEAEMQVAGFQNGYFTALCNRVGKEDCIEFEGKSFITAPNGKIVAQAPAGEEAILIQEIDLDDVKNSHAQRHFLKDRRAEVYQAWLSL